MPAYRHQFFYRLDSLSYVQPVKAMQPSISINTTTIFRPFFQDHPGELVPEENFWTLWCKGRLTEADTPTIWLGTTPSILTSAHLHHPPFFTGRMPLLPPNQQCQSTEGKADVARVDYSAMSCHFICLKRKCHTCIAGRHLSLLMGNL